MNPSLILNAAFAALDLAIRIAESRGYDPAELEQYIQQRNDLRAALVKEAVGLGDQNPPLVPDSSDPVREQIAESRGYNEAVPDAAIRDDLNSAFADPEDAPVHTGETADETTSDQNQG